MSDATLAASALPAPRTSPENAPRAAVPTCAHTCWFVDTLLADRARARGLPLGHVRLEVGLDGVEGEA